MDTGSFLSRSASGSTDSENVDLPDVKRTSTLETAVPISPVAFVFLRMMEPGEEPVRFSLRLASLDL